VIVKACFFYKKCLFGVYKLNFMCYNERAKQKRIFLTREVCVFLFFDKNTDALLLHVFLRVVKAFVWRQLELRIFCASASVDALFLQNLLTLFSRFLIAAIEAKTCNARLRLPRFCF